MFRKQTIPVAMATIISLASAAGIAYAGDELSDKEEMAAILDAKIPLAQAIATAEQETGGKALGASLEKRDGAIGFSVDVVKGDTAQEVFIDTQSGKVLKVVTDQGDNGENGEDGEDDGNGDQEDQ